MTKKYIRTEDRIYEFEKVKTRKFLQIGNVSKEVELDEDESIFPYPILKQSDNLKDLCDEFVVMSGYSLRHYQFKTLRNAVKHSKLYPFEVMYIYGAIWTDKGLIYVAKMNEKGDLELL